MIQSEYSVGRGTCGGGTDGGSPLLGWEDAPRGSVFP